MWPTSRPRALRSSARGSLSTRVPEPRTRSRSKSRKRSQAWRAVSSSGVGILGDHLRVTRLRVRARGLRRAWASAFLVCGIVVVVCMSEPKRRVPPVVVREARTALLSETDRQQAVTALAVMIQQWWSEGHGRIADADDGSDRHGGDTAGSEPFRARPRTRRVTVRSVTETPMPGRV
jgi:hypothetical protein